ncbi:MAG: hypothetical protein QM728_02245 [Gordonia sp. (in: high G+C Gram-positive bacteria)]|uniref:hypothetical protein n=1 Tax=Gordonia sp. (in: high G+C Gram-positive bacteria) TaxID=84139 RepID=UPI0039E63488
MRKPLTTAVVTATIGAAAVAGTVLAAPEAQARIAPGRYTYTTVTITEFGTAPMTGPATIRGNVMDTVGAFGIPVRYRIRPTASGGVIDAAGSRFILDRKTRGRYSGPVLRNGRLVGRNTLVPLRRR